MPKVSNIFIKRSFILFILTTLLLISNSFFYNLQTYSNARYGFSIQYPADLLTEKTYPENGDGIWLRDRSGSVELIPSASLNINASSIKQIYRDAIKWKEDDKDIEITYKVQKKNWYVLSGYNYRKSSIFYIKYYSTGDILSGFTISYPIRDKRKYNQLINILSKSFRPSPQ